MASGDMLSSDRITTSNDKHDEVFTRTKAWRPVDFEERRVAPADNYRII